MRIGLVAGEASGDALGAGLIRELRRRFPNAEFEGVAGPRMRAEGCHGLADIGELAVMGLTEVLAHLPRLLRLRRSLRRHFTTNPPDVFIGIDAPDFNLGLERALRRQRIRTVHYVSPSVWAWRSGRVRTVGAAADLVLCLLPFEPAIYEREGISAVFVGHPLADRLTPAGEPQTAREALGMPPRKPVLALLPGSRRTEMSALGEIFIETARRLRDAHPELQFVAPMATSKLAAQFQELHGRIAPDLAVTILDGQAERAMAAADAVLLASGTATLESLLLGRPMVVAYRLSAVTYAILKGLGLLRLTRFSLPNLLAGRDLVPECMQSAAQPDTLVAELERVLFDADVRREQIQGFAALGETLRRNADHEAAGAVAALVGARDASDARKGVHD
ncbi:MAG: lipid-A-disaccharide synthase [Gammaproteobacteria bacterium]|jgi:lipid-A-disaccharide synthase